MTSLLLCYDHVFFFLSRAMFMVCDNFFLSQISLFDKNTKLDTLCCCFIFFFFCNFTSLWNPQICDPSVKCLASCKNIKKKQTWGVAIFLIKHRSLPGKLMFKGKKVLPGAQKCKCVYCLLECVIHGKEEKDPGRWFAICTTRMLLEGVRVLFKSHASGTLSFLATK